MTDLVQLLREFGWPVLITFGIITLAFLGVFVWFSWNLIKKMDE